MKVARNLTSLSYPISRSVLNRWLCVLATPPVKHPQIQVDPSGIALFQAPESNEQIPIRATNPIPRMRRSKNQNLPHRTGICPDFRIISEKTKIPEKLGGMISKKTHCLWQKKNHPAITTATRVAKPEIASRLSELTQKATPVLIQQENMRGPLDDSAKLPAIPKIPLPKIVIIH